MPLKADFNLGRVHRVTIASMIAATFLLANASPGNARDILLIDDYEGGFGATAAILNAAGHTVTEFTDESLGGYSRISDSAFLANYDMVIYSARDYSVPPAVATNSLKSYIANGGDLLVTGVSDDATATDRDFPDLLRALGPEWSYQLQETDQTVSTIDNYITNGLHGDFRGTAIANSTSEEALFANTGLGTVPLVQGAEGEPDKIIFTDLPGAGGSIGVWQGRQREEELIAQPDFIDGGTYQGMLLNWAEGGTTTQTEVAPRVFSTALHPLESTITVDLYFGDPNSGGEFAASIGTSIEIDGTMDIVASLDGSANGSVAITNASLSASDLTDLLADFGTLGTALIDVGILDVYIANQTTAITANGFDLVDSPYYLAGINQGELTVHSPTGAIEILFDEFLPLSEETSLFYGGPSDFVHPVFNGTFDEGVGLFTDLAELNLVYDNASLKLFEIEDVGPVFALLNGEIHVAYVPEPSSLLLGSLSIVGFLAACWRRHR